MYILQDKLNDILGNTPLKIIISKPRAKTLGFKKLELELKDSGYLATKYTEKQVFHEKVPKSKLFSYCHELLMAEYQQLNAWSAGHEYMLMVSKNGLVSYKAKQLSAAAMPKTTPTHNREKNYIIPEGVVIPPLVDMGVFTKEGKVVSSMYDKYRQINRFIELIDDVIKNCPPKHLNIIDFGCGKSYLTFILYYYFTEIKKIPVNIVGLDLKAEVIGNCNKSARKYSYNNLHFELGDINGYKCNGDIDMVISLHACDTATDYALYNAVMWNAKMIFSVPCCQHELNEQIKSEQLALLTRYGIVKERFSALATDAIRGGLLEACGYKTQLLEFVDFAHTPKNILIRAIKKNTTAASKKLALKETTQLMDTFGFKPTLYSLLKNNNNCFYF